MALSIPPGVDANGRRNAIFVPTDTLSVAVLTGPTAVELMCYLSKGTFGFSSETERGTDDRECTLVSAEVLGNTKYSMNDLEYVYEPQDDGTSPTNKAYNLLGPATGGGTGFLIVRSGILQSVPPTPGDRVRKYPITLGPQVEKPVDGSNPAEKLKITQAVVIGQGVDLNAVLVA